MSNICLCFLWAFLHLARPGPSCHLPSASRSAAAFHRLHSTRTSLTFQMTALAEFCAFWPLFAGQFLQQPWSLQAVKAAQRPSYTLVSCGWHHGKCNPPMTNARLGGWKGWAFCTELSYLQKHFLSYSLIVHWRYIRFLVRLFLFWFLFFFFSCLAIFVPCFTFTKVFAELDFQTACREKLASADALSPFSAFPTHLACWVYLLFTPRPGNLIF